MKIGPIFRSAFGVVLLAMVFSIAISAQSGGNSIRGVVKSSSGRVLNSVWVVLSQGGVEKGKSLTDDEGTYYISGLSEGAYEIAVLRGDREVSREYINLPGDRSHDITIKLKH